MEGEKCVEALCRFGIKATCNDGGAGKWRPNHSKYLQGADVVILPDNDVPGRNHAEQVARLLSGVAKTVRVVELPGLPQKGDIVDWLATGHARDDLLGLVEQAPEWDGPDKRNERKEHSFNLKRASVILATEEKETSYLWDGRLGWVGLRKSMSPSFRISSGDRRVLGRRVCETTWREC
ncbi:MAG: hypothetical protein ACWGQW_06815 [bacterium]